MMLAQSFPTLHFDISPVSSLGTEGGCGVVFPCPEDEQIQNSLSSPCEFQTARKTRSVL